MASSLNVKLGVLDKDYSEALERNARKFKVFGRELNQGTLELGRSLGQAGGALGRLGSGFQIAGTAAGVFAGADGLLGIAGSLASGGLLLGGMAAMSFALSQFEKDSEEAKKAAEQFNKEIGKIPQNARGLSVLESNVKTLRNAIDALQSKQAAQATPAASAVGAAGLGSEIARQGGIVEYIKGIFGGSSLDRTVQQLKMELDTASTAAEDLGNALNTPEAIAAQLNERVVRTAQAMGELGRNGQPIGGLFAEIAALSAQIDANLRAAGDPMSQNAATAREQAIALEDAARAVAKIQNGQAALQAFRLEQKGFPGSIIGGVPFQQALAGMTLDNISFAGRLHGNAINPLGFQDLDPKLFEPVRELVDGTNNVKLAIDAGFQELPGALAGVLGPIIAGLFGNSRGAQIGGTLGAAFGSGVGGYAGKALGAGIGGAIGGAVFPVIGGLVGGVLGGALGSLFGGHKKAVDENSAYLSANTSALNRLTETLTNVPSGYKVGKAAYQASDAVIVMDGRAVARVVLNTLRRESQAQFGNTLRIAEVSL